MQFQGPFPRTLYIRVCDKFFVTKLVWQFSSLFCYQSKSGTFNNMHCVFILQYAFYDFKFVVLACKGLVNCLSLVTLEQLSCWFFVGQWLELSWAELTQFRALLLKETSLTILAIFISVVRKSLIRTRIHLCIPILFGSAYRLRGRSVEWFQKFSHNLMYYK